MTFALATAPMPAHPRVTWVIQESGLGADFGRVPAHVLQAAIARGNAVHEAVELVDHGTLDETSVPTRLAGYLVAYRRFVADVGYRPIATEMELRHPLGYVGRCDKAGWIGSGRLLVDIKTPVSLNPGPLLLQLAAYAHAWPETFPSEPLQGAGCLQLRPDGTYKWRRHDLEAAWSVFVAALHMLHGCASSAQLAAIRAWAQRYPNP